MKNNKSIYSLLFLLLIAPIILSACSFSWPNSNSALLKEENTEKQKGEIVDNQIEEVEYLYSHRLKIYSNYEDLNNFINNNKEKAELKEIKDNTFSSYFNDGNNLNLYKEGDIVAESENYIAYVNKDKLYLLENNINDSKFEIVEEKQLDFSVAGIIFYNNILIVNGKSQYNGDYIIDIYDVSDNKLSNIKQYFFSGQNLNLFERQGYLYLVFETINADNIYPDIFNGYENGNIFENCVEDNSCWSTYYFDSPYENYYYLTVAHLNLNDLDSQLLGQFYLLNNNHEVVVTDNGFYINYNLILDKSLYEYQFKKEIISQKLDEEKKAQLNEIEKLSILNEVEKKEKSDELFDNYLATLSETERILVEADISDAVNKKISELPNSSNNSIVHRFTFDGHTVSYYAKQNLRGYFKDNSRILESNDKVYIYNFSERYNEEEKKINDYTNLFILDDKLDILGKMEKLGTKEEIDAVYYVGSRAFLFSEESALFYVIDISNLDDLTFLGSIKLSGLNNYIQSLDSEGKYFISLAKNITEDENKEIKLSLYDFTDIKNPKELDSYLISENLDELIVFEDINSFYYKNNIISFPVAFYELGRLSFSGSFFFNYYNNELEFLGRLDHSAGGFFNQKYFFDSVERRENQVLRFIENQDKILSFSGKYATIGDISDIENSIYLSLEDNPDDSLISSFVNEGLVAEEELLEENASSSEEIIETELEEEVIDQEDFNDIYEEFEIIPVPEEFSTNSEDNIIIDSGIINNEELI